MMQRNLKKESIKYPLKGFALMELIVGIIIASISSLAILYGVLYVQYNSHAVRIKERAYEELKSYTELWKGKIAAKNISEGGVLSEEKFVCLDLIENSDGSCNNNATLYSYLNLIDTGMSHAHRNGLKTRIVWETRSGDQKEIDFYLEQMIFE